MQTLSLLVQELHGDTPVPSPVSPQDGATHWRQDQLPGPRDTDLLSSEWSLALREKVGFLYLVLRLDSRNLCTLVSDVLVMETNGSNRVVLGFCGYVYRYRG